MSDRPTPETDALANTVWDDGGDDYSAYAKMLGFARRLERERDEAREQLAEWANRKAVLRQNTELRAEVERLRGELQMAATSLPLDSPAYQRAAKALAAKEGA